jgi:hypothetical protein
MSRHTGRDSLKQAMRQLNRGLRASGNTADVNVSSRHNIVINANTGEDGAEEHASATQVTEINQQ